MLLRYCLKHGKYVCKYQHQNHIILNYINKNVWILQKKILFKYQKKR